MKHSPEGAATDHGDDAPPSAAAQAHTIAAFTPILAGHAEAEAIARMAQHWLMVLQGNARHNLTGIRGDAQAATMHYLDGCYAARALAPGSVVDFGSGAGYPGLVFAALAPSRPVGLVEPRRLRAAFLRQCVHRLGWAQAQVFACRVQAAPPARFANAVCRAVFASDAALAAAAPWLQPGGRLLSLRAATAPCSDAAGALRRIDVLPYQVGHSARRVDVWQLPT